MKSKKSDYQRLIKCSKYANLLLQIDNEISFFFGNYSEKEKKEDHFTNTSIVETISDLHIGHSCLRIRWRHS